MDTLVRDVIIGAIGSVIGALFVMLGSQGLRFSKAARQKRRNLRTREGAQWLTGNASIRQAISNTYLFDILKYLLFGNLFLAVPTVATFLDITNEVGFIAYRIILSVGGSIAFACFFMGLGRASRYMRLRAQASEFDAV